MSKIMHKLISNIKRQRKVAGYWNVAAVTPFYKKDDKRLVENYRFVSLLNIDSKLLENAFIKHSIDISLNNCAQTNTVLQAKDHF